MIREGKGTGERRGRGRGKMVMYFVITLCPVPPMEKKKAVTWWIPLNFLDHSVDLSTEVKYAVQTILSYSSDCRQIYSAGGCHSCFLTIKVQ